MTLKLDLDLKTFLRVMFPGVPPESIQLCGFPGEPKSGNWNGLRYSELTRPFPPDWNQYFCIGVLSPTSRRRSIENVVENGIIALDDIGTAPNSKVDPRQIKAWLTDKLIRSTAVVETSQGNFSLYYRVTVAAGEDSIGRLQSLRGRLVELGLTDPACVDPCRYMRLPWGINGKSGWPVRLVSWQPYVTQYRQWARAIFSDAAQEALALDHARHITNFGERHGTLDDPLVALAERVGLDPRETRPGVIEADCPFGDEHSGGDLSGFAFVNWGRCKCHHGHCASRKSKDFIEKMLALYDRQIAVGLLDGTYQTTPNDTVVEDRAGSLVPATGLTLLTTLASARMEHSDVLLRLCGEPPKPTLDISRLRIDQRSE